MVVAGRATNYPGVSTIRRLVSVCNLHPPTNTYPHQTPMSEAAQRAVFDCLRSGRVVTLPEGWTFYDRGTRFFVGCTSGDHPYLFPLDATEVQRARREGQEAQKRNFESFIPRLIVLAWEALRAMERNHVLFHQGWDARTQDLFMGSTPDKNYLLVEISRLPTELRDILARGTCRSYGGEEASVSILDPRSSIAHVKFRNTSGVDLLSTLSDEELLRPLVEFVRASCEAGGEFSLVTSRVDRVRNFQISAKSKPLGYLRVRVKQGTVSRELLEELDLDVWKGSEVVSAAAPTERREVLETVASALESKEACSSLVPVVVEHRAAPTPPTRAPWRGRGPRREELPLGFLVLRNQGLRTFPVEILCRTNLTFLDLSGNPLRRLPSEIGQLERLNELRVVRSELQSIPSSIGRLVNLKFLHLDNNQLTTLPEELFQLPRLKRLHLNHNRLQSLSEGVGFLSELHTLHVSENELTNLPDAIGRLSNLSELRIDQNQLSRLPDTLGDLSALKYLCAEHNLLTALPSTMEALQSLVFVYLYHNRLTSFPEEVARLPNLRALDVSYNLLTSLPSPRAFTAKINAEHNPIGGLESEDR